MGLLDLSTSASSKKHVDLNDARYQLVDKLKNNDKKNIRPTFTLYDNKEIGKVTTKEISAAYDLSDKKLPMGELMNKMVDMVVDLEDGVLHSEKDCIYAWKYSVAIMAMYEDKINNKRQSTLVSFDNGLKNLLLTSQEFASHYPGRYTSRTNFFDAKVKDQLILDIIEIFRHAAVPKLHELAIEKSKIIAERHDNPTLNKIIQWAIDNYKCTVDSYFDVKVDPDTQLYYSLNTVILHLKNGYDMSIVGFVGTDHDDKFAISVFNTNDANMEKHDDKLGKGDVQGVLDEIAELEAVSPMHKILQVEKKRKEELNAQLEYLRTIRPMVKAELLALPVAEKVVGTDYLWACERNRNAYGELPEGFTFDDLQIPEVTASRHDLFEEEIVTGLTNLDEEKPIVEEPAVTPVVAPVEVVEEPVAQVVETPEVETLKEVVKDVKPVEEKAAEPAINPADLFAENKPVETPKKDSVDSLFETTTPKTQPTPKKEKKEQAAPVFETPPPVFATKPTTKDTFNSAAILLPGVVINDDDDDDDDVPNYTGSAVQAEKPVELPQMTWLKPETNAPVSEPKPASEPKKEEDATVMPTLAGIGIEPVEETVEPVVEKEKPQAKPKDDEDEILTPDLMFDDIDSLFQ